MKGRDLCITKSNALVEAGYKLTLNEQRLVLACIAKIDSRGKLPDGSKFTVHVDEFARMFDIDGSTAFAAIKEAEKTLFERKIFVLDGNDREKMRWISTVKYHDGESKLTLTFNPDLAPYLSQLREQFTSYKLLQVSGFKSIYSIRIYELLIQFKHIGRRLITLEQFRRCLCLENEYSRFVDFKRWVIEPAVAEINEKSDLQVDWEAKRTGKAVHTLEFAFKLAKSDLADPDRSPEKPKPVPDFPRIMREAEAARLEASQRTASKYLGEMRAALKASLGRPPGRPAPHGRAEPSSERPDGEAE